MFFMNNKKNMETSKRSKAVTIEQLYLRGSYFKRIIANSKVYYVLFRPSFAVVFKTNSI